MNIYANPYLETSKEMYFILKQYHKKVTKDKTEMDILQEPNLPCNDEEFKNNLQIICNTIDQIVEAIDQEEIKNPVRMLGMKIDSNFLKDFYIAVITYSFLFPISIYYQYICFSIKRLGS
jgi:hypothetical protein